MTTTPVFNLSTTEPPKTEPVVDPPLPPPAEPTVHVPDPVQQAIGDAMEYSVVPDQEPTPNNYGMVVIDGEEFIMKERPPLFLVMQMKNATDQQDVALALGPMNNLVQFVFGTEQFYKMQAAMMGMDAEAADVLMTQIVDAVMEVMTGRPKK